jgi:hypothetical protein
MDLPPLLRRAVDDVLEGTALSDLAATAAVLSQRYREERHDAKPHAISDRDALAYLAVRLPATYAAVRASFDAVAEARPDFTPKTALDIGAGPGTALWAASECWPGLADAVLIEASAKFRDYGERLAAGLEVPHITWRVADAACFAKALGADCGHSGDRRTGNAGRVAADSCRAQPADRGRRACDRALPACARVPASAAGLVSFRRARCPLARPSANQTHGRPLGRREIQLSGSFAKTGTACRSASYSSPPKSQRSYDPEAVPGRRIGERSGGLTPRRRAVQARAESGLGLFALRTLLLSSGSSRSRRVDRDRP